MASKRPQTIRSLYLHSTGASKTRHKIRFVGRGEVVAALTLIGSARPKPATKFGRQIGVSHLDVVTVISFPLYGA